MLLKVVFFFQFHLKKIQVLPKEKKFIEAPKIHSLSTYTICVVVFSFLKEKKQKKTNFCMFITFLSDGVLLIKSLFFVLNVYLAYCIK